MFIRGKKIPKTAWKWDVFIPVTATAWMEISGLIFYIFPLKDASGVMRQDLRLDFKDVFLID